MTVVRATRAFAFGAPLAVVAAVLVGPADRVGGRATWFVVVLAAVGAGAVAATRLG